MSEKSKNFIVDVVPLTRISLSHQQHFSYLSSQKIPVGSLVSIPLFRRTVNGIAVNNRSDFFRFGNIRLKMVNKVIAESFVTANQLELAKFISDYYICPLGIALKFFTPRITKARKTEKATSILKPKKIILTKEQQLAVNEIAENNSKFYLYGPSSSGKTEVYIHSITAIKNKNSQSQFLILLPEITLTPQAIERYGQYFKKEEIVLLNSKISKGEFYQGWEKIRTGEAKIIIGTRMAALAPFKNLGLIIIDEEQDNSFKQWDMNPRYDVRTVADKLARIYQAKIVRGSATPRVESYYRALQGEYKLLELPPLKIPVIKYRISNTIVVDMRKEYWNNKNRRIKQTVIISETLRSEIEYALKHQQQSILFVNRRGMSSFSICAACKTVLRCPKCERALVYESEGFYQCPHCNYKTDVFATCPKCKGTIFKNIGIGTQTVEKEIRKLFPSAIIKRVDFSTMKFQGAQEKLYQELAGHKIDILIGTQMATKGWDFPSVSLIGIVDADSLLTVPDLNTDENAFHNILQVSGRTGRIGSKSPGTIIIQTYNPDNFVIKTAASRDIEGFYRKEIEERKTLKYPPFYRLIRLLFQEKNKAKVEQEAKKIYDEIKEAASGDKNVRVSVPQEPLLNKIRGRFRKQIIIKMKSPTFPPSLHRVIIKLGSGWIVDVDPINII